MPSHVVLTTVADQPGMLSALTQVLAHHDANIVHVDIIRHADRDAEIYFEFACDRPIEDVVAALQSVPGVKGVVQKVFMAQEALDPAHSLEACALLKEVK